MDECNAIPIAPNGTILCGKSWTAYIGMALLALVLFFGLLPAAFWWSERAAAGVLLVSALVVGYRVLHIRSYQLYYDDLGVWLYSGILPWKKGLSGVKWRDMDEASFVPNFWSWLFKSYSIHIGHRFTESSGMSLTCMAHGKDVVAALNAQHQYLIREHLIV